MPYIVAVCAGGGQKKHNIAREDRPGGAAHRSASEGIARRSDRAMKNAATALSASAGM